jgi:NADPH2:quinone reductase
VSLNNVTPPELRQISQSLFPLLGTILHPVVRKVYSLEELGAAQDDVLRPGALGNLVIKIA